MSRFNDMIRLFILAICIFAAGCTTTQFKDHRMPKLTWEQTVAIREALLHSRMDHPGPRDTAAHARIQAAEDELAGLLGMPMPFTYAPETDAPAKEITVP